MDRGVSFSNVIVDDIAANTGQFPSVATSGTAVGVAYYDVTNDGLKFARWTPTTGWKRYSVDGIAGTGSCGNVADNAGKYASLAFTSSGRPVIAYQSNGALKLAYASNALTSSTYSWTCISLDASGNTRGEGVDLAIDSNGQPHITHFDLTATQVRYLKCSSDVATCVSTGSSAFSGETVAAVGTATLYATRPSIGVNSSGVVYISMYSGVYQALALMSKSATATSWSEEFIDQNTGGGSYTSLAGQYPELLVNDSGYPLIFYRSMENFLKYFSREASL